MSDFWMHTQEHRQALADSGIVNARAAREWGGVDTAMCRLYEGYVRLDANRLISYGPPLPAEGAP